MNNHINILLTGNRKRNEKGNSRGWRRKSREWKRRNRGRPNTFVRCA